MLGTPRSSASWLIHLPVPLAPAVSRIVYEFPQRGSQPPLTVVWLDGELTPPRPFDLDAGTPWPPGSSGQLWIGDEGTLVAGIYGEEPYLANSERHQALLSDPPSKQYPRTDGVYAEWITACKNGGKAGSDFAEHSGPLTEMVLLGNLAVRTQQALEFDHRTGQVTNVTVPGELFRSEYREGWSF